MAIQLPSIAAKTGADGALAPLADTVLTLPPNGIFNFTTINIPSGVTVTFTRNASNTPVTFLATGDVTIAGTIDISGQNGEDGNSGNVPAGAGGKGGPGGFDGGYGGIPPNAGMSAILPGTGLGPGAVEGDLTLLTAEAVVVLVLTVMTVSVPLVVLHMVLLHSCL